MKVRLLLMVVGISLAGMVLLGADAPTAPPSAGGLTREFCIPEVGPIFQGEKCTEYQGMGVFKETYKGRILSDEGVFNGSVAIISQDHRVIKKIVKDGELVSGVFQGHLNYQEPPESMSMRPLPDNIISVEKLDGTWTIAPKMRLKGSLIITRVKEKDRVVVKVEDKRYPIDNIKPE